MSSCYSFPVSYSQVGYAWLALYSRNLNSDSGMKGGGGGGRGDVMVVILSENGGDARRKI